MLNIGNKKYRNMQEQVAWNQEQILKIAEYLDGLDLQDSVLVLDSLSTLTADQLKIVNNPVAFIVYGDELYIKTKVDSTKAYFEKLIDVSQDTYVTLTNNYLEVTLSNGAIGAITSSVNLYSSSQIDTLLASKATLGENANFGSITVEKIEQSQSNLELTPASLSEAGGLDGLGLTKRERFVRVQQINAELHIIVNVAMENTTGSTVTIPNGAFLYGSITIPSSIASKIYDEVGKNFTETADSTKNKVVVVPVLINVGNSMQQGRLTVWHSSINIMYFSIMVNASITVPNGDQAYFSGRVQLSLL